jgi:hypothetical protein
VLAPAAGVALMVTRVEAREGARVVALIDRLRRQLQPPPPARPAPKESPRGG